jgi:hypothetical protein
MTELWITYEHAPRFVRNSERILGRKRKFRFVFVIGEGCSTEGTQEIALWLSEQVPV